MPEKNLIFRYSVTVLISVSCVSFIFAQKKPATDPTKNLQNFTKEDKVNKTYKIWEDEDVKYIITPEERRAFDKLKTNEERENFIAVFWKRRDPNPDTEENEYREEYYERIAYANEHFTTGIPGWKTDRGRVYISRGKPDEIESHPSGGSYDRPSYEGGGTTTTYPFETWFYRHLDGIGDGVEIEFVDPTGTGEYRIARDADEKNALANVPGAGAKLNNDPQTYQRRQDLPFERLAVASGLDKAPPVRFTDLELPIMSAGSVLVQNENTINFDLQVDFFRQSDNRVIAAFTVQAENKELSFREANGIQTAQMSIFGRVTAIAGQKPGLFEDVVLTNATAQELTEAKSGKSVYQKAIVLSPGVYKVDVAIRDVVSGKKGVVSRGFTVPKYDAEKLSTSTMILASRLYQTTDKDIGGRFVIGDKKVIPNLAGVYKKGEDVGIYLQVYNAGIDQTTLKPAVDVEYVLIKDGREIMNQPENWEGLSDSGQRLTLARLIPTDKLSPGNYEIKIKIRDRVSNQSLEPSEKFTITK